MRILIALPAYNEAATIASVIARIPKTIEGIVPDILVVDDWSKDTTKDIALTAWANLVLQHTKNRGVGAGFSTAVEYFLLAGYDVLVTIDADGQFPPEAIPDLAAPLLAWNADLSFATRYWGIKPVNMPFHKYVLNKIISYSVGTLMWGKVSDLTCGFRAYTQKSLLEINLFSPYTYTQEVVIDAVSKKLNIVRVPVQVTYFDGRVSRVVSSIFQYMKKSILIILRTVRDAKPLVFFGLSGIGFIFAGLVFLLYFLVNYLIVRQTTPFRTEFFTGSFLFLFGTLLVILALIADSIKRHRILTEAVLKELKITRIERQQQNNVFAFENTRIYKKETNE